MFLKEEKSHRDASRAPVHTISGSSQQRSKEQDCWLSFLTSAIEDLREDGGTMRVILRENIENLGKKGDIVNVAPGYGRNYLIPKKIAIEVTPRNMKMIAIEQKALKKGLEKEMASYQEIIARLNAVTLSFMRKTSEKDVIFGSVSSTDIRDALAALGFDVEKKKILLDEPIKRLGNFTVPIKIFHEEKAEVKLEIVKEGEPGLKEDREPEPAPVVEEAAVPESAEATQELPVKDKGILEEVKEAPEEEEAALEEPGERPAIVKDVPEEVEKTPKEEKEAFEEAEEPEALDEVRIAKDEKGPPEKPSIEETKEIPQETSEGSLDVLETEPEEGHEKADGVPDEAGSVSEEEKERPEDETEKTEDAEDRPEELMEGSEEVKESPEDTDVVSEEAKGTAEDKDSQEAASKEKK